MYGYYDLYCQRPCCNYYYCYCNGYYRRHHYRHHHHDYYRNDYYYPGYWDYRYRPWR